MGESVTLKEVARQAGVSTATVARVLHNQGYVAPETRERIEEAIHLTGYRINKLAQSLRKRRTMTIGHLLRSVFINPFFSGVALGVQQGAVSHGYQALIFNAQNDPSGERAGLEIFVERQVDAIIMSTPINPENVLFALSTGLPIVQVERPSEVKTPAVIVNNYSGATKAMRHLMDLGHRDIGYIGVRPGGSSRQVDIVEQQRLDGYLSQINGTDAVNLREEYESLEGYLGFKRLLEQQPGLSAVFVASDILAAGALQAAYEKRLRIPEDISIVGYDDTYGQYLSPALTTVRQPMEEMGQMAVQIVFDEIEARNGAVTRTRIEELEPELIVRSSTGSA
jgi:DNA-binding LacI/PurR family transcriptional regulator